jgi:hypothetical protein
MKAKDELLLKSCPFCGKDKAECHKENEGCYIVECGFCRAASRRRPTRKLAIKAWNPRPAPADELLRRLLDLWNANHIQVNNMDHEAKIVEVLDFAKEIEAHLQEK